MSYELSAPSARYGPDLEPSESYTDVVETGHAHAEQPVATVAGETSSRQFSLMLTAASTLAKHCSENAEDLFDVHDVSAFLNLSLTAAHGLIDVLDVLEIIRPRGNQYLWRGTAHVPIMLQSTSKFQAGASMSTGVAVPKVCRAMIPHLQNNEGVVFTASEMAALLWQTQDNPEDIGEYAANQQQRALSAIVTDVLGVLAGLDHISTDARADGNLAFTFVLKERQQGLVSPRGQAQSSRMRSMRIMFDGPPESGTPPRTVVPPIARPSSASSARARGPNSARDAAAAERALAEVLSARPSSAAPGCPVSPLIHGVPTRPPSRGSYNAAAPGAGGLPLERSHSHIHCTSPHRAPSRPGSATSHSSGPRVAPPVPPLNMGSPYNPPARKRLSFDSATAANAAGAVAANAHQIKAQPSLPRPSSASNRLAHQPSLPRQPSLSRQSSLTRVGSASVAPPPTCLPSQSSMHAYDRPDSARYESHPEDLSPMSQQRSQAFYYKPNTSTAHSPHQYQYAYAHAHQHSPISTNEWCGMQQELTSHSLLCGYGPETWTESSLPAMEHSLPRLPMTPPRVMHERSYTSSRSPAANYSALGGYPTAPPLQQSASVMDAGGYMYRHSHQEDFLHDSPSAMQLPYGRGGGYGGGGGRYYAGGRRASTSHRTTAANTGQSNGVGGNLSRSYSRTENVMCEEASRPGTWQGGRDADGVPLPEPSRAPLSPRVQNNKVGDVKSLKHMFETTRISQIQPFKLPHSRVRNMARQLEVVHSSPLHEQEV